MEDPSKSAFNFCLHERKHKAIIKHAEEDLFFTRIDREELGVVDLLIEVFKIKSKTWWLQMKENTIEKMKLCKVEEDRTIRNPTERKEIEHCHFFKSKILIDVMKSYALEDVNVHSEIE